MESERRFEEKPIKENFLLKVFVTILFICSLVCLFFALVTVFKSTNNNKANTITSHTLMEAINIEELSSCELVYNGIVPIYESSTSKEIECYARYESFLKVGIDLSDVKIIDIDTKNKTVEISIPPMHIIGSPSIDEKSIECLDTGTATVFSEIWGDEPKLKKVLTACKSDVLSEAEQKQQVFDIAKNNLKLTFEALLKPLLQKDNYSIVWLEETEDSAD